MVGPRPGHNTVRLSRFSALNSPTVGVMRRADVAAHIWKPTLAQGCNDQRGNGATASEG